MYAVNPVIPSVFLSKDNQKADLNQKSGCKALQMIPYNVFPA